MPEPRRDRHIPDLVSLTEAAEMLHISRAAAHKMVMGGRLVGAQVGTTWVFRRAAVERYVEHATPAAGSAPTA